MRLRRGLRCSHAQYCTVAPAAAMMDLGSHARILERKHLAANYSLGVIYIEQEHRRMAPAKIGKKKTAAKQRKNTVTDDEEYRKTTLEVDALKQHLVLRRDIARQAISDSERLKQKLGVLEEELERTRGDKKDIYEEMIRQYQHLQHQTDTQIHQLEAENRTLKEKLAACQEEVKQSHMDKAKMLEEKDKAMAEMQHKIDEMETEYEKILHASLDSLVSKLQTSTISWEKEATVIHLEYKDRLKEFGLTPLEF